MSVKRLGHYAVTEMHIHTSTGPNQKSRKQHPLRTSHCEGVTKMGTYGTRARGGQSYKGHPKTSSIKPYFFVHSHSIFKMYM